MPLDGIRHQSPERSHRTVRDVKGGKVEFSAIFSEEDELNEFYKLVFHAVNMIACIQYYFYSSPWIGAC